MRVTLYEPALAVDGKAYAGWANKGDELYFPHVDSCCAVLIYGDKAVVGGHMGCQLPGKGVDYPGAGRYVWSLVLANHHRLNTRDADCTVVTIGHPNWYFHQVNQQIWTAAAPGATLALSTTEKFCSKGADIVATMEKIVVVPCGSRAAFEYKLPADGEYLGPSNVGE